MKWRSKFREEVRRLGSSTDMNLDSREEEDWLCCLPRGVYEKRFVVDMGAFFFCERPLGYTVVFWGN